MSHAARRLVVWMFVFALSVVGCDPPVRSRPVATPVMTDAPPAEKALAAEPEPVAPDPSERVPVTANEPAWGDPLAPVTWVVWGDYECPFTAKLFLRLDSYMTEYGPQKLRIVWRHYPLPAHKDARTLAIATETVFRQAGYRAFWKLSHALFAHQGAVSPENLAKWIAATGVSSKKFSEAFGAATHASKIDDDVTLGKQVGVAATPASFINGVFMSGAQGDEKFVAVIEEQLKKADALAELGVAPEHIYARLVEANYVKPAANDPAPPEDTTTVWRVAVGGSPVRGKKTAPVTLVMFDDFECQFCAKVKPTIAALVAEYGDKLRLVLKHNPLTFHARAEPAAQFVIEARAQGGDAKLWAAYDLLHANHEHLTDADLAAHGAALGLDPLRTANAIAKHKHAAVIEADQDAAFDLAAEGTPHFFINGRRLVGAQPVAKFKSIIDEEVARAEKLLAAGTPAAKLYEALQKDARGPPPLERILAPAATAANPAKGAGAGAKVVVVQMFSDFQCPFCARVAPTMDELIAAFPNKVRVVFRHRPLPMHAQAQLAAEAAMEAFAQKGNTGFWAFAKLLWEDQSTTALSKDGLIEKAKTAGLDAARLKTALEAGSHRAAVEADNKLAEQLHISGTPSFAVNDYFVSGAQPLGAFKRAVRLALGPRVPPTPESLVGATPAPGTAAAAAVATPIPAATGPMFGAKHLLVMYKGSMRAPATVVRSKAEAKARAEQARKLAKAGAKFEDLVTVYSDEPGAAARGGDLGKFPAGRMVADFQTGVENTNVGEISEVIETPFGYHVILRTQ